MQGDKISISKLYKDIRQSRLCSTRLEASSGPRTKGVLTNNQNVKRLKGKRDITSRFRFYFTECIKIFCFIFSKSSNRYFSGAAFGQSDGPSFLVNLNCDGDESDIANCKNVTWITAACSHDHDVGVSCSTYKIAC